MYSKKVKHIKFRKVFEGKSILLRIRTKLKKNPGVVAELCLFWKNYIFLVFVFVPFSFSHTKIWKINLLSIIVKKAFFDLPLTFFLKYFNLQYFIYYRFYERYKAERKIFLTKHNNSCIVENVNFELLTRQTQTFLQIKLSIIFQRKRNQNDAM